MAEFTAFRNNALPYPVYSLPYVVSFPLLDADGDPVSPSSPDSEVSKNGDTFADCTNEATEIATSSGICYLSLTGTELTTDCAAVRVQSTGAKTTVLTLYPRKLVTIRTGTSASGGAVTSSIVLDASASAVDDFYNGMIVAAVIDSVTEVRMITDYTGSNQTAAVTPDWNTAPDNNDTFTVYRPDGVQIQQANTTHISSTAQTARDIGASVLLSSGTGTGQIKLSSGYAAPNWGDVGNPTTTVTLSGTTVKTATDVETDTQDIQSRLPPALVSGRMNSNMAAISDDQAAADMLEAAFDGTGYGPLLIQTSIATLSSQTSFTLTAGSTNDDAYNGCTAIIQSSTLGPQKAVAVISDYTGVTKTVTLRTDPAVYTMGASDIITIVADKSLKPTVDFRTLDVTSTGTAGVDWANVENLTTTNALTNTTISASQVAASVTGAVGSIATGGITAASFAAGAIDAAAIATDAIGANEVSAAAVTKIQTGLSTLDAAGVRTAVGLASANLDTQLGAIDDAVDTEITDIRNRLPAALVSGKMDSHLATAADSFDIYHADIQFTRDQSNTQDEYTVTWMKNGVRVTAGITSPEIQVVVRADGSDLIAATAMTQIGSTGSYKYDATGAERITVGEAVLVVVTATIDSGSRAFSRLIGRDS